MSGFFKASLFFCIMFIGTPLWSQICSGDIIVPVVDFNQCNENEWMLVFSDEFDGDKLDLSKWSNRAWSEGDLNNGPTVQYYTLDNVKVNGGFCSLTAKKESVIRKAVSYYENNKILEDGEPNLRTFKYTSGWIQSRREFMFGKIEARIKIPDGNGFWPAFWLFSSPPWNELDIFEFWNEHKGSKLDRERTGRVHHMTAHFGDDNKGEKKMCESNYTGPDFSQDFHVFTIIWERDKIQWLVDGDLKRTDHRYYTLTGQAVGCRMWAWKQYIRNRVYPVDPMSLYLNLAVMKGENEPDETSEFPVQMEIDWVRFYERRQ